MSSRSTLLKLGLLDHDRIRTRNFSVDGGEALSPAVTTESEPAEPSGEFTSEVGEARSPKKAKYIVEQILDVRSTVLRGH